LGDNVVVAVVLKTIVVVQKDQKGTALQDKGNKEARQGKPKPTITTTITTKTKTV